MYANITGISAAGPGYRKIVIRPRPGGEVARASGRYDSLYGPIETHWRTGDGTFALDVSIPVNSTAEVWVPARAADDVSRRGAKFLRLEDGAAVFEIGFGSHRFSVRNR